MPRSLVSYWKRVARSGPTVDGREILPQELRDIAETYSATEYTAVIWCEHERWSGSHGTVFAVRLVDDAEDLKPGQVALEAQLKPNDRLLWLNDKSEKLFTSIEITPNFASTGKAYLTGLAVTDSPASLGTQELYFSSKTSKAAFFADPVPLTSLSEGKPESDMGTLTRMFSQFLKRFSADGQEADTSTDTPTESKPPMDEATATAAQGLVDQMLIVAAGWQALIDSAATVTPEADTGAVDTVQGAVDDIISTAEEEKKLSRRQTAGNKAVLAGQARIEKMFQKILDTPQGRQFARTTGNADQKKRVL